MFYFSLFLLIYPVVAGVEAGGWLLIYIYIYIYVCMYLRSMDVPGGLAWSTYTYDLFDYLLVGIYANMAEMPGVCQIYGSCRNFCSNWKIILKYKNEFWEK